MGRTKRDCPLCQAKNLLRLDHHLQGVHHLRGKEKRKYLMVNKNSATEEEESTGDAVQETQPTKPVATEDIVKKLSKWDVSRVLLHEGIRFT